MSKGANTNDQPTTDADKIAWDDIDAETQHELVSLAKTLGSDQPEEDAKAQASRREIIKTAGALGLGAAVGGGSYRAFTQPAAASHGGGSVGTSSNPVDLYADLVESDRNLYAGITEQEATNNIGGSFSTLDGYLLAGSDGTAAAMLVSAGSATSGSSRYHGFRSRGSVSSPSVVQGGDHVTEYRSWAYGGDDDYHVVANTKVEAGAPSGTSNEIIPGSYEFQTRDSSNNFATRATIDDTGVTTDSLSTDRLNSTYWIQSGDDAQSIIEGAGTGATFVLEPGATFDAADIQFPDNHFVIGNNATFRKSANGAIATVGDDSYMMHVNFDGNKANFTGDGVVDAHNDAIRVHWLDVEIHDCAGDGRWHNARSRASYPQCRFYLNDGYGLVEGVNGTTDTRCRRNRYDQTYISSNGKGGILIETDVEETVYAPRCGDNQGAGIEFSPKNTSDKLEAVEIKGTWSLNDGPMFYQADGECWDVDVTGGIIKSNLDNITNTPMSASITSSYGQIHFEGGSVDRFQISGGHHRAGSTDSQAFIAAHTGTIETVLITGGDGPSGEQITGTNLELELYGSDGSNWNMSLNVDEGLAVGHNANGRSWFRDLATGDTARFGRIDVRTINSPQSGDRGVHNGSGSNTFGPAIYNGTSWISVVDGTTIS